MDTENWDYDGFVAPTVRVGDFLVPSDPADLTVCDGCQ